MTSDSASTRLRDAVLRAADLGPDYEEIEGTASPMVMGDSLMHYISRDVTDEIIMISFNPASHGTPRQLASVTTAWAWRSRKPDRPDFGDDESPPFGDDSVAFRWRTDKGSEKRNGHLVAWRYGDVVASVTVQGRDEPNAMGYALRQHQKLRAAFPTPPTFETDDGEVDPIVKVECPESHPIRGVLLEDGARIYLKPMDAAYDVATPARCFSSDAAAERAGYHRRPDEAPRWEPTRSR
jgi:hypothetical protein